MAAVLLASRSISTARSGRRVSGRKVGATPSRHAPNRPDNLITKFHSRRFPSTSRISFSTPKTPRKRNSKLLRSAADSPGGRMSRSPRCSLSRRRTANSTPSGSRSSARTRSIGGTLPKLHPSQLFTAWEKQVKRVLLNPGGPLLFPMHVVHYTARDASGRFRAFDIMLHPTEDKSVTFGETRVDGTE